MFQRNPDDIILSQIRRNGSHALSNHVTLVTLIPVGVHPIFVRVDGDCGHGELVGCTEDTDGDFTSVGNEDFFELSIVSGLFLSEGVDAACQELWRRLGLHYYWDRRQRQRKGRS
jgi:hypothetical protein